MTSKARNLTWKGGLFLEWSLSGMSLSIHLNQRGTLQEAGDLPQALPDPRQFVLAHPRASHAPMCTPDRGAALASWLTDRRRK